jgi:PAS domain S-box-containing protein
LIANIFLLNFYPVTATKNLNLNPEPQKVRVEKIPLKKKPGKEDIFLNALAEAYRLQESIINTTELSIISTTPDGLITSFNKAAEKLTGYTAEEMIGKASPVLLHDKIELIEQAEVLSSELGKEVEPNFEVFTLKGKHIASDRREWTYIRKDGTRFPVLLSITALWDDNKKLIGYVGIASDITVSKTAEQKLRDSESHLQALLNSIDDIAVEVSREGVYTNIWTKKDYLLFITPREEYVGKKLEDVLPEDLLIQFRPAIAKVLETQQSEYFEYLTPQGRWSAAKISYINDDRVLMLIRNITEKKNAEILLAQSEQKFRTLAENIPGVIYLCRNDEFFSMLYVSDGVKDITGYEAEDFTSGKVNFTDLYHPDDRDYIFRDFAFAMSNGARFHLRYRIRHRNGEWRWLDEVGAGVQSGDKVELIEGFMSDITLQKQAETELQKIAEENYRLFNNPVTLNVIAGLDGNFKRINPTWTQLFGWSEEEYRSKEFFEFIHPDDVEATRRAMSNLEKGNNLLSFENHYRCKDGTYRCLLWAAAADLNHQLIYASAIDITERKKQEQELLRSKQNIEAIAMKLQEQNRQLDEFAHIISHNLRSPIGNIKALIGLLNSNSSIAEYHQIFEKLKNVANNLGETMNELMETLKVKKETTIERVDIRFKEIIDKVVQSLEGELIQTEAQLTFDFNEAPSIYYSRPYLESIIQNLLTNALKYRSPKRKPHIFVSTQRMGPSIVLRVTDNGLGINMALFGDKLFGLHKTFHEHKDARGVGLFLIKTQIEALNGTIRAESEVDKGTTFIITF